MHGWFSGRILACHAGGPGSIPGPCSHSVPFWSHGAAPQPNWVCPLKRARGSAPANAGLLPAARCLSHADAQDPSPPHPQKALLPSLRGPKPCGLSRPCVQAPFLRVLASSPGPSRGLGDCTGRNTPPLAAARTTLHLSQRPSPSSLPHSPHTPRELSPATFAQPGARELPHLASIPPFGLQGPWTMSGRRSSKEVHQLPALGPRASAEIGLQQQHPHHLKHHPFPLKPSCAPHLSISPAPRAPPPQPAASPSPYSPTCTHPTPSAPPPPSPHTPPPTPRSSLSRSKSHSCQGTCLCICPTGRPPPTHSCFHQSVLLSTAQFSVCLDSYPLLRFHTKRLTFYKF